MNIVYMMYKDIWNYISEEEFMKLFPLRYERAKKYRFDCDRYRCIGVGVLLYKVLGLEEKDILYNEYGKPFSKQGTLFSISHSGDFVVLAYSSDFVGVDIEQADRDYLEIMPQVFTEDEIAYVKGDLKRFYQIWTLKESLSKAVGEGLNMPMQKVSVLNFLNNEPVRLKGKFWYGSTCDFSDGNYVLSCVKNEKIKTSITRL